MSRPTGEVERVCHRCGTVAAPDEFFCDLCTARLPDPPSYVVAPLTDGVPVRAGWRVLLTLLAVVLVVGGVLVGSVAVYLHLDPFGAAPPRPGEVVQAYYEAAEDGDCAAAAALETVEHRSRVRCEETAARLDDTGGPAVVVGNDLLVDDVLVLEDEASVRVRLMVGESALERCTFDLVLDEVWLISGSVCEAPTRS